MSILFLGQTASDAFGTYDLKKQDKFLVLEQEYERSYWVIGSTLSDGEDTILLAAGSGVPQIGDTLSGALLRNSTAKEHERIKHPLTGVATILWKVTCRFSTDYRPGTVIGDPRSNPPVYGWHSESEDELLQYDAVDPTITVMSSAGDPLLCTAPRARPILTVERYETWPYDPTMILNYVDHVNNSSFAGAPTGCALMAGIEVSEETIEHAKYAKVKYSIKFKIKQDSSGSFQVDSWKVYLLNQGYKYFKGGALGVPLIHTDANGNPTVVNLNTDGTLNSSQLPANAVYISFNQFPKANFSTLSLI